MAEDFDVEALLGTYFIPFIFFCYLTMSNLYIIHFLYPLNPEAPYNSSKNGLSDEKLKLEDYER